MNIKIINFDECKTEKVKTRGLGGVRGLVTTNFSRKLGSIYIFFKYLPVKMCSHLAAFNCLFFKSMLLYIHGK